MDKIFAPDRLTDRLDFVDAINERITKARAITSCLLAGCNGEMELCNEAFYNVIWIVDDYLEELGYLFERMEIENKQLPAQG